MSIARRPFGDRVKIYVDGGSHSPEIVLTMDGVPAGLSLGAEDFLSDIERRRGGGRGTTRRKESDIPYIIRGVKDGVTTGTTLRISFRNENIRPQDYFETRSIPRPGHADMVRLQRYGKEEYLSGGDIFSGRMTLPVVAAGVVAKKMLESLSERRIRINAYPLEIGGVAIPEEHRSAPLEYPPFSDRLEEVISEGDSIGGVIECYADGVPPGIGEPLFYPLEATISQMIFSIPGIRGIEFGDGFKASIMVGSEHNDPITDSSGHTSKNGAGGINGGLSNGNRILFRVAVKPASSISKVQKSYNLESGMMTEFSVRGRHDSCFALRISPVIEAALAVVLIQYDLEGVRW